MIGLWVVKSMTELNTYALPFTTNGNSKAGPVKPVCELFITVTRLGVLSKRMVVPAAEFGAFAVIVKVVVPAPDIIVVTQLSFVGAPVQFAFDRYHGEAAALAAIIVWPKSSNSSVSSVKVESFGLTGISA